jgi:hypothetical protein
MASISRAAAAIAAILVREGVDYAQSKAVFKVARERAGLHAQLWQGRSRCLRQSLSFLGTEAHARRLSQIYRL